MKCGCGKSSPSYVSKACKDKAYATSVALTKVALQIHRLGMTIDDAWTKAAMLLVDSRTK